MSPSQRRPAPQPPPRPLPPTLRLFTHPAPVDGTVEAHAVKHGLTLAKFEAAKAMHRWPNNAEVDEETFLSQVAAVDAVTLR